MRHAGWLTLLGLAVFLLLPGVAVCADKGGGVDIFKPALDLGIWTLVVFLLLVFILGKFAWKPMLEGLQKREENIQHALSEAEQARHEALKLRDQLQAEINKAHEKVRDILDEARRDAQSTKDDLLNQARAEIQTERDRLRREIETARDQAMQQLWNQSAQLATLISTKAVRRHLSPDDHHRLVDEAIAEFGKAGAAYSKLA